MKYIFEVKSKVDRSISLEIKHRKTIEGLKLVPAPWGVPEQDYPVPKFGSGLVVTFSLRKLLGKEVKGDIIYFYRGLESVNFDTIYLEFNPQKVDCKNLAPNVLKDYVSLFNPTEANIYNEEIIFYDYDRREQNGFEKHYRFYPAFFWSEEYCKTKIGLTLTEFKSKISGSIEYAEFFLNGIIVVATSKFLDLQESNKLDTDLKALFK